MSLHWRGGVSDSDQLQQYGGGGGEALINQTLNPLPTTGHHLGGISLLLTGALLLNRISRAVALRPWHTRVEK